MSAKIVRIELPLDCRLDLRRLSPRQGEQLAQLIQKSPFAIRQAAIRFTHAQRHFISKLALADITQYRCGVGQGRALEQHILIQTGKIGRTFCTRQIFRHTADRLALPLILGTIGKGGVNGNGKNGVVLFALHSCSCRSNMIMHNKSAIIRRHNFETNRQMRT